MYKGEGFPKIRQGNEMIAFMGGKEVSKYFNGSLDNASLETWYQEDPLNHHLGLMAYWNQHDVNRPISLFDNLLTTRSVLEVNGEDGAFSWDVNVDKDNGMYVAEDASYQTNAGIDESVFYVTLNKELAPGTLISYDDLYGVQMIVADTEEEVEPTGTGFRHPMQVASRDKRTSFPAQYLTKGTEYFIVAHATPEYGTKLAKLELPDTPGKQRFVFQLGSVSGVEAAITSTAGRKSLAPGVIAASTEEYKNSILSEMDKYGFGEFAVRLDIGSDGRPNLNSANIGSTFEYLVKKQLHKLFGTKLMFQRSAEIRSGNGVIRLNEGLWPQLLRGYTIEYGRKGGITKQHISDAVEYVHRGSSLPVRERYTKFKCGTQAYYNVLEIFQEEINLQLANTGPLLGAERLIPNPVSGPLDKLKWSPATFTQVFLPTIGNVEIELDQSLDYGPRADRFAKGMNPDGKSVTTYAMIISDASSPEYSNRQQGIPQGTTLVEGGRKNANVYLVKPEGDMIYTGTSNGRYSAFQSKDILASTKYRSQEYWAWGNMDIVVTDPSKFVMIHLDRDAA